MNNTKIDPNAPAYPFPANDLNMEPFYGVQTRVYIYTRLYAAILGNPAYDHMSLVDKAREANYATDIAIEILNV